MYAFFIDIMIFSLLSLQLHCILLVVFVIVDLFIFKSYSGILNLFYILLSLN